MAFHRGANVRGAFHLEPFNNMISRYEVGFIIDSFFFHRTSLSETFSRTDHVLEEVHTWPEFTETSFQILNSKLRFQIKLEDLRYFYL